MTDESITPTRARAERAARWLLDNLGPMHKYDLTIRDALLRVEFHGPEHDGVVTLRQELLGEPGAFWRVESGRGARFADDVWFEGIEAAFSYVNDQLAKVYEARVERLAEQLDQAREQLSEVRGR